MNFKLERERERDSNQVTIYVDYQIITIFFFFEGNQIITI